MLLVRNGNGLSVSQCAMTLYRSIVPLPRSTNKGRVGFGCTIKARAGYKTRASRDRLNAHRPRRVAHGSHIKPPAQPPAAAQANRTALSGVCQCG
eukprot:5223795-Prymnesium_polylepis.1